MKPYAVKRPLRHRQRRKFVEILAAQQGVTVEHFLEVVANRKKLKLARFHRRRARRRHLASNMNAIRRFRDKDRLYAGEGELHELMRQIGMTREQFCELAGIKISTFDHWYGYPMHGWPLALLRSHVWATNMAKFIESKGWDPNQFKAKSLPRTTEGRYPRTSSQFPKFDPPAKG